MARIHVASDEELDTLISSISDDTVTASIHWTLRKNLTAAVKDHALEFNQSNTFWFLTFNAHWDTAFYRLCRLYDQEKSALNLRNFLLTIEVNVSRFEQSAFRKRLKLNQFVDSLSAPNRIPDPSVLAADIASVSANSNALVKRLTKIRNNVLAHRGPSVLLRPDPSEVLSLSEVEFDELILRAQTIVNRYSGLFRAQTNSMQMMGADDFKSVLKYVRAGLRASDAED